MSRIERVEVVGDECEFYFADSPEAFVIQEFNRNTVTRTVLEVIATAILNFNDLQGED
jgi:hypothetical protein